MYSIVEKVKARMLLNGVTKEQMNSWLFHIVKNNESLVLGELKRTWSAPFTDREMLLDNTLAFNKWLPLSICLCPPTAATSSAHTSATAGGAAVAGTRATVSAPSAVCRGSGECQFQGPTHLRAQHVAPSSCSPHAIYIAVEHEKKGFADAAEQESGAGGKRPRLS